MALVCKGCGESYVFGKIMGDGYYVPPGIKDLETSINDFFDKHHYCMKLECEGFEGENQFYLAYEHPRSGRDNENHYDGKKNLEEYWGEKYDS